MSELYDVSSLCLRYIVPFKYSGTIEDAIKKIESLYEEKTKKDGMIQRWNLWERRICTLDGPESDLYGYVRNEYRFSNDTDPLPEEKTGCEWIFWNSKMAKGKTGQKIKELLYVPDRGSMKSNGLLDAWQVNVVNLGLQLFRDGLGFVWYELEISGKDLNSNELKHFQNTIQELNRGELSVVWEKQKTDMEPAFGIVWKEHPRQYKTYGIPFSLGYWVHSTIEFLDVTYLAERKSSYEHMMVNTRKALQMLPNQVFSNERWEANLSEARKDNLPDKAILFTYASLERRTEERNVNDQYELSFHLANGYKDSYHFSEERRREIQRPFDNVFWYATQEGVAYLSWPDHDNKKVFEEVILSKAKTDYFTLYVKTLYQSFSLLIYAERIQRELSAVSEEYLKEKIDLRITNLVSEINLFLTKSMSTSVSHIHHQSEFYVYLKKQLRIHEDVKSVTAGLNALDLLQREQRQRVESKRNYEAWMEEKKRDDAEQKENREREKREKKRDSKLQAILGLFALLGISSAFADCIDFFGKFDLRSGEFWNYLGFTQIQVIIASIVMAVISLITIIATVQAIWEAFKKEDKEKTHLKDERSEK